MKGRTLNAGQRGREEQRRCLSFAEEFWDKLRPRAIVVLEFNTNMSVNVVDTPVDTPVASYTQLRSGR